jgi:molecular chaperone GrpE
MTHDADRPHKPKNVSKRLDPSAEAEQGGAERLADAEEASAPAPDAQLAELTDRHLRLAAEYDNFRRRTGKERTDLWARAQADLLSHIVDALDDMTRIARVEPAQVDAKTLHEGVHLVERKLWKELEAAGVRRVDQAGVAFDPNVHDAVTTAPAADPSQDHMVGAVLQAGYKLGDLLIRPARVQVLTWQGREGRGTGEE